MIHFPELFYLQRISLVILQLGWIIWLFLTKNPFRGSGGCGGGLKKFEFDTLFFTILFCCLSMILVILHAILCSTLKYTNGVTGMPDSPAPWFRLIPYIFWREQAQSLLFICNVLWGLSLVFKSITIWLPIGLWHFASRVKPPIRQTTCTPVQEGKREEEEENYLRYSKYERSGEVIFMILLSLVSFLTPVALPFLFRTTDTQAVVVTTLPYFMNVIFQLIFCISIWVHLRKVVKAARQIEKEYGTPMKAKVSAHLSTLAGNVSVTFSHLAFVLLLEMLSLSLFLWHLYHYPELLLESPNYPLVGMSSFFYLLSCTLSYPIAIRTLFLE
jgi:hypothetical protein